MGTATPTPFAAGSARPASAAGRIAAKFAVGGHASGCVQAARLAACAARVAAAAIAGRLADVFHSPSAREQRRAARRERAVGRVVATLGALKGAFAKAAQFAALRHDLLSGGAIASLAALRDRVPPLPFERIREVVEDSLGTPLGAAFAGFEHEPIGAASLAQAHRARLPSGRPVVVKVQYPWLRASAPADLALLRACTFLFARRSGSVDWRRLFAEFAAGYRSELDFIEEASSAEAIAANLAGDRNVVVPRPVPSHTRRRVLTMEEHPAVPIADSAGLARLGVEPRAVLEIIGRAYAKQIFVDGLFHADPHPGNLMVLDEPTAATQPRVLFIDFGLCRQLDPDLRRELRLGLYALIQRDVDAFVERMDHMGMIAPGAREGVWRAVSGMFERIAVAGGALAASGSAVLALKDEALVLLQRTPGLQLPADLLLYAKTLSSLFALGAELDPGVDMLKLSLPYLLQFLASRD
jgi:ubiquinone biosynthesis protein